MIPYGRQTISEEDIEAVVKVLRSEFLTQGDQVPQFEKAVCQYVGASHAIAVNSATSALHLACLSLGLGKGDWLWTTPITFVASANCALYCGAQVDFVDIDPQTYNLSVEVLEEKLVEADKEGRLPKVVVPVHLCGQSCEMAKIYHLSQEYGFSIIEDASHAIGGMYQGQMIGDCRYSDITVFSFHPVKVMTTGEGGMALTNSAELAGKMTLLRSHGITRDADQMTHAPDGDWYYQQLMLGYNYRMTDLQAALGISQLHRLDAFIDQRHQIAKQYDCKLNVEGIVLPTEHEAARSAFHLYVIRVAKNYRKKIYQYLIGQGIGVNVHYIPIYTQPFYQHLGFTADRFPEAERYYQEAISLPIYPSLQQEHLDRVITSVNHAFEVV